MHRLNNVAGVPSRCAGPPTQPNNQVHRIGTVRLSDVGKRTSRTSKAVKRSVMSDTVLHGSGVTAPSRTIACGFILAIAGRASTEGSEAAGQVVL
jgi:hypothetical protein